MASETVKSPNWPNGTSVGAYDATGISNWPGKPPGAAVATAVVSGNAVTFTGLTSGRSYFAAAEVGGAWVVVRFHVGAESTRVPVYTPDLLGGVLETMRGEYTVIATQALIEAIVNEKAQPLDGDLTAIAALATTSFGRSLLTQATAAEARTTLGAQASLGFTAEDVANKDTTATLGTSDTKYPSQKAVKTYADAIKAEFPFINVKDAAYGAKGDGTTDDTTALQNAINAAITAQVPVYLPPGEYKTTANLNANTTGKPSAKFCMFGSGSTSVIVPTASTFDCLTVGPGAEGSGVGPGGYLRDFKIAGGNQTITTKGIAKGEGTAALKINGMRMFEVSNVEIRGSHDISLDLVNNCWGSTFKNCRFGFETCRVGINVRSGPQTGEDITFLDCWVSGEVAAVFMEEGQGYRFIGGQYSASRQATEAENERGVFILGKNYLTGAAGGECDINLQTSFEFFKWCYAIRAFKPVYLWARSNFNASTGPALGFYKNSEHAHSQVILESCNWHGEYTKSKAETMVVREGSNSSSVWVEFGSHGRYNDEEGEQHAYFNPMYQRGKIPRATGQRENVGILAGVELALENEAPVISVDKGVTFRSIAGRVEEIASANTMSPKATATFLKVTGTTEIKKITATFAGHVVTLKFASTPKVVDGENLKLNGNLEPTADTTLTLACDGTNWYEIARSKN